MPKLIVIALLVAIQTAQGRNLPEVKGPLRIQLIAAYGQMHKCMENKDLKGVMAKFSDTAMVKWPKGTAFGRKEISAMTEAGFKDTRKLVKSKYAVDYVRGAGPAYEMKVSGSTTRIVNAKDGKPHELQSRSSRVITFIKEAGSWKVKRMEILSQTNKVDGKPA